MITVVQRMGAILILSTREPAIFVDSFIGLFSNFPFNPTFLP